ncbi:MAG: DUF3500 domain-containing protein [SAR202 cluster bacterium]|nr:DUF3500 domain-containing protein [SAR202 cluster bacterium]
MSTDHDHDHDHGHEQAHAVGEITQAASAFLRSLSADQKAKATFHYLDGERIFWYYPPMNRHGLPLRDMDKNQRSLAMAIVEKTLDPVAYHRTKQIIDHESILGPIEKEAGVISFSRNPELYYWTIFGEPGGEDPWGWRAEGHHVSLHFSIWGDKIIATTPFFFGANPAEVLKGDQAGLRILSNREDMALELINSLDSGQRTRAIVEDAAPWDIYSYNSSKAVFPKEEGLPGSQMNGTQQEMLMSLITEYVTQVRHDISHDKMTAIQEEGVGNFHLAWAGGTEAFKGHYYRIHSGNFVVEYDNVQNGANHVHSVIRDVDNDFASDVMREHHLMYHVL